MPLYMTQFTYTPEAWAALVANPTDRSEGFNQLMQSIGGRMLGLYYTTGEWDGMVLFEAPDETAAMAALFAAIAPGHLKATKSTRLIEPSEAVEAMRRAQGLSYSAPQR